jgi:4a-hydroxytetrahydrobiopterin dehydratase
MSTPLARRQCVPCHGGVPPLPPQRIQELLGQLEKGWTIEGGYHLTRTFTLPDFSASLELTNRIGEIAEQQNHHPDIHLAWGRVKVEVWTHKISGLTESDFIFAARVDQALHSAAAPDAAICGP